MASLFIQTLSTVGGALGSAFQLVTDIMQGGFRAAMQFHQEGIALARDLGLSASQAQGYTQALTKSTIKLADEYGVTADAIKAIQRGISEATGRQLLLNDAQREQFVIADKLVGVQTRNEFTAEIMNKLGGQVSTVEGAISKAYATAAKSGLNASKFSEKVAKNLSLANKLSFRNGIDGIIKMTVLSEKLGFNLQSITTATDKFMELDKAIASSAQLQMLGGAAGAYGSNPLTMSYEANYDPEAFTERMTNMLGGYAQFNTKTGVADVNGMNKDFVKAIGDAMGIGMEEAMSIAKKQAEVKFKEARFDTDLGAKFGNDTELKNYFLNNSTYNTKSNQLELNGVALKDINNSDLREIMEFNAKTDHELMAEQARALTSLPEQLNASADKVAASFAEGIERYLPGFKEQIKKIGEFLSGHAKNWGKSVGKGLSHLLTFLEKNGDGILNTTEKVFRGIDKVMNAIGPIIKWVTENPWTSLFAFIAARSVLGSLGGSRLGVKLASKAATKGWQGIKWSGNWLLKGAKGFLGAASNAVSKAVTKGLQGIKLGGNWLLKGAKGFLGAASNAVSKAVTKGLQGIKWGGEWLLKGAKGFWGAASNAVKNGWSSIKNGNTKLHNAQRKFDVNKASAKKELRNIKANAKRSYKNTLNKGGSKIRALKNASKNILKNVKSAKALKSVVKTVGKGIGGGLIAGVAGMGVDYFADKALAEGKMKKGGKAHQASKALSKGLEWAGTGAMIGSLLGPLGTAIGASVGGLAGSVKGAYDAWKSLPENADKNILDYAKSVGKSIADSGKHALGWAKEKLSNALNSDTWKQIRVASKANPITGIITEVIEFFKGPREYLANAKQGFKNVIKNVTEFPKNIEQWLYDFTKDKKWLPTLGRNYREEEAKEKKSNGETNVAKPKETTIEKHEFGGVIGGNSYTGDNVLTRVNSGEAVINPKQFNALFGYVSESSNILSKLGSSNGVSYYTTSRNNVNTVLPSSFTNTSNVSTNSSNINPLSNVFSTALNNTSNVSASNSNSNISSLSNVFSTALSNTSNVSTNSSNINPLSNVFSTALSNTSNVSTSNSNISSLSNILSTIFNSNSNVVSSALNTNNSIKTIPFGENSFKKIPTTTQELGNGVKEVTVKDMNINLSGTIKLDGGNSSRDIEIDKLLSDSTFVSALKELIKQGINNDMNNGRFMNDVASTLRGYPSQIGLFGRG